MPEKTENRVQWTETSLDGRSMLTIRCSACKQKLWKYKKLGPGEVLRCHKTRITRVYAYKLEGEKIKCPCGQVIGIDKGRYFKMIRKAFTYSGTKDPKL